MAKGSDTYTVERTAMMAAEPQRVYDQLADFHQWMKWSPWEDLDPHQQRTFTGAAYGTGAAYAWSGNRKAGRGRMEITDATPPSAIRIALTFNKPFKSSNSTAFRLEPHGTGTHVTWTMTGPHSTMTKVMGVFKSMDAMVGPDFERGLARLKAVVETPAA